MAHEIVTIPSAAGRGEAFSIEQPLAAGYYWRLKVDLDDSRHRKGDVLLLQSIRDVEGKPHTVEVRGHPRQGARPWILEFLVSDFLAKFEHEPDGEAVRQQEIAGIYQQIAEQQQELAEASAKPEVLARLSGATATPGSELPEHVVLGSQLASTSLMNTGLTTERFEAIKEQVGNQVAIASAKAAWIKSKTEAIAKTIGTLAPYYQEQAEVQLSRTEDVRRHVQRLQDGLQTLDLYLGKNVQVETICTGAEAPVTVPLTLSQQILIMEEELAVFLDVGAGFDFEDQVVFFTELKADPRLRDQIFSSERSVVLMRVRRHIKSRPDSDPYDMRPLLDMKAFLLIRNGDNIHAVDSSEIFHERAVRLFPGLDEIDALFTDRNGEAIRLNDVRYSYKVERHDDLASGYVRFMVLLCGLDHRLGLLGRFYPESEQAHFMTKHFQAKYCRFIHDADGTGLLPTATPPMGLEAFFKHKNACLQSGSRVAVFYEDLFDKETTPGWIDYSSFRDHSRITCDFVEPSGIHTVSREDGSLVIKVAIRRNRFDEKQINAKALLMTRHGVADGVLCLDAVTAEELEAYIFNRRERRSHLQYLRLFKKAVAYLRAEERAEAPFRAGLVGALVVGGVADRPAAEDIAKKAVMLWRADHRGATIPEQACALQGKAWDELSRVAFAIAGFAEKVFLRVQTMLEQKRQRLLRLSVTGVGGFAAYTAVPADEEDRVGGPHVALKRFEFDGKLTLKREEWVFASLMVSGEQVVFEDPEMPVWIGKKKSNLLPQEKRECLALVEGVQDWLKPYNSPSADEWDVQFAEYVRLCRSSKARFVTHPITVVPIGLVYQEKSNRYSFLVAHEASTSRLMRAAPDAHRKDLLVRFEIGRYAHKEHARKMMDACLAATAPEFLLRLVRISDRKALATGKMAHAELDVISMECIMGVSVAFDEAMQQAMAADGIKVVLAPWLQGVASVNAALSAGMAAPALG